MSGDTMLRRIKAIPMNGPAAPIRNLGVDDWAWRKGQDYGTILVDLDQHRVVDLLANRSVDAFRTWLEQHPGVAAIARDRSGSYTDAGFLGAPEAQQVADRFHLLLNLSAAVESLRRTSQQLSLPSPSEPEAPNGANTPAAVAPPTTQQLAKLQRRERRLAYYRQVMDLHEQGHSVSAISRVVHLERKTIRRWIRAGQFLERKRPIRPRPKVQAFTNDLQRRWAEGCRNATKLFQEIRELGYRGGRSMVAQFVSGWRKAGKPVKPHAAQRIAPRHAAILMTRAPERLSPAQQLVLDRLAVKCPDSIRIRRMSLDFRQTLTSGDSLHLRHWIERVKRSEIGRMVRFAWGLTKDLAAVNAAVDTEWSSGQVEGQINRLKTLKRQMCGRDGFALLRARVLPFVTAGRISRAP